jgi:hypothetical protein
MPGNKHQKPSDDGTRPVEEPARPGVNDQRVAAGDPDRETARRVRFGIWDLGLHAREITREDADDDDR